MTQGILCTLTYHYFRSGWDRNGTSGLRWIGAASEVYPNALAHGHKTFDLLRRGLPAETARRRTPRRALFLLGQSKTSTAGCSCYSLQLFLNRLCRLLLLWLGTFASCLSKMWATKTKRIQTESPQLGQ